MVATSYFYILFGGYTKTLMPLRRWRHERRKSLQNNIPITKYHFWETELGFM